MNRLEHSSTDKTLSTTVPFSAAKHRQPEADRKKRLWAVHVVLFIAVLSVFASNWRFAFTNGYFDTMAGASTTGAMRVLSGELPYRDFWTTMPPGSFYLLAFLFRIFGNELMVEVIAASVLCALAVVLYFSVLRAVCGHTALSAVGAALFTSALFNTGYYTRLDGYPPALLCTSISLYLVLGYIRSSKTPLLLCAGFVTGIAVVCKDDFGFYTAIAVGIGLAVHRWVSRAGNLVVNLGLYLAGIIAISLPVILYFNAVAGADFWNSFVEYPLRDHRLVGSKPNLNPFIFQIIGATTADKVDNVFQYLKFSLAIFAGLIGLTTIVIAARRRDSLYAPIATVIGALCCIHFTAAHIHINQNIVNVAAYAAANCILLIFLATESNSRQRRKAVLVFAGIIGVWLLALVGRPAYKIVTRHLDSQMTDLRIPRISGFKGRPAEVEGFRDLVSFVHERVGPGQYVYVGSLRHDIMLVSEMLVYFLLDRQIAVRYHDFHPAIVTTASVQKEMIASLERTAPPVVILKESFANSVLDSVLTSYRERLPDIGSVDLDGYIRTHYHREKQIGPYILLLRN